VPVSTAISRSNRMSSPIRAELRIPDIWYDFFTRLLPGYAFWASIWYLVKGPEEPGTMTAVLAVPAGYFIALAVQPVTLILIKWLEKQAERGKESDFVVKIQSLLGPETRRSLILSKIGAELTFFSQVVILSLVASAAAFYQKKFSFGFVGIIVSCYAAFGAFTYAKHRVKKAESYCENANKSILPSPNNGAADG